MIGLRYSAKTLFYVQRLNKQVKAGTTSGLYRTAGFVRSTARRSLRVRPGASTPGFPPHAHTRAGLRVIEFDVDPVAEAAIVGPIKFPGSNYFNEPVTYIHEFGGTFLSLRGYWRYPERSYMYYTLKKLVASGRIPKEFSLAMGRIIS